MPIQPGFFKRLESVIVDVVDTYGTPFHIYDEAGIIANHQMMVDAFDGWPFQQYFAVKALPNPAVLKMLLKMGSGLDCSSPVELRLAEFAGATEKQVIFTSNNTTLEEYKLALSKGALITFDDKAHMDRVTELPSIVAFRVSPHGNSAQSSLMGSVGQSKFGVPLSRLPEAYISARQRGATRFGIHGMTCANELQVNRAICASNDLVATAAMVEREANITFEYINFGGGLGIPYRPEEVPFDFSAYANAISTALIKTFPGRRPRILMECGRYVTGPHGVLVAQVVNRTYKEREIVGLDASMSALMRPGFYRNAYHHITLPLAGKRADKRVDVVGSLCENVDRFASNRLLPNPIEGDLVYVHDTGAHGHAMGFTYNGRLRPPELLLTEAGDVVEIRRPETFEDYVATVRWQPITVRPSELLDK